MLITLIMSVGIYYFLNHGYDYTLPENDTLSKSTYGASAECSQKQAAKTALEAPILAEMQPLAASLIHDPLPKQDGEEVYDKYAALREQVNQLETKYAC